ncbi:MAG: ABC transporter substrate-binding protein [Burkholderiales bacterium]
MTEPHPPRSDRRAAPDDDAQVGAARALRRRRLVAAFLCAAALPRVTHAAPLAPLGGRPARVALLMTGTTDSHGHVLAAFTAAMAQLGWVEGRDVVYTVRWAGGRTDRYAPLAAELARQDPDIVVTGTAAATRAAAEAAPRAVILMGYGSDPVGNGLVASLARPGGRVTGLTNLGEGIVGKMVELLRTLVPRARRFAIVVNPGNPTSKLFRADAVNAATTLEVATDVRELAAPEGLPALFADLARLRPDGVVVTPDPLFLAQRLAFAERAASARLPFIYFQREFVQAGGLLSYGSSLRDAYARAAAYADRLLKGADPATLPVEQPTRFELTVNTATARSLGLTVPQSLLLRADEVIS